MDSPLGIFKFLFDKTIQRVPNLPGYRGNVGLQAAAPNNQNDHRSNEMLAPRPSNGGRQASKITSKLFVRYEVKETKIGTQHVLRLVLGFS